MSLKTFNGSALIAYGPSLPATTAASDGGLFYKTDSSGGQAQGLYMYGFVKDANASTLGFQAAQSWVQVVSPDLFVSKAGDTMTGSLSVNSLLKVTTTDTASTRILIGSSASSAMPTVITGSAGALTIGTGSNWSTGGTSDVSLSLDPALGAAGITWLGYQVWHAGKQGSGSGLDADKLDGSDSSFYLNASNISTGTLSTARGGTGRDNSGVAAGSVAYFSTSSGSIVLNGTGAGTAGQVLISAGAGAPVWTNTSSLAVGSATTANTANSATTATSATTAGTATNVGWTGITGLNPAAFGNAATSLQSFADFPSSGFTTYARPSYFFDVGSSNLSSMTPAQYPKASVSGFDSYYTSDMGSTLVGLTVSGVTASSRQAQLAFNWNFEENTPSGALKYRVNDDTGTISAWGPWRTVWDQGNLTNLSQLNNDVGYVTQAATGGGSDHVFWENDQVVTTSYTITSGKNAMTAGPITIANGVTVTIPNGSTWTIV